MNKIPISVQSAIYRRLNMYLKKCGILEPHKLKKIDRVREYCKIEGKEVPTSKMAIYFLHDEYLNNNSSISSTVKIASKSKRRKEFKEKKKQYNQYLNSPKWKSFRMSIIQERGYKCEECGMDKGVLHAHHITYERFMNEDKSDIQLLCVPCHKKKHK